MYVYYGRTDNTSKLGHSAYEFVGGGGHTRVWLHPITRWWNDVAFTGTSWTVRERCNALQADFNSVWEMIEMARGGKRPAETSGGFGKTVWVNVSLTAEDRKALVETKMSSKAVEDGVMTLLAGGFKISIFWDKDSSSVGVILFDRREGVPTQDWALSARAPSMLEALTVALYKHYEKLGGDWTRHQTDHPEERYG